MYYISGKEACQPLGVSTEVCYTFTKEQLAKEADGLLIYNQRTDPRGRLRYGLCSSAVTGCGWIAAYNVLRLLGIPAEPAELIRCYRRKLPLLNGALGTFLPHVAGYFRRRGFAVRVVRRSGFDEALDCGDVGVLYFWWRDGLRLGTHFAAVERRQDGFVGYNTYRNSVGPDRLGVSLETFLEERRYFWPVLIAVRKTEAGH